MVTKKYVDELTHDILGAAIEISKEVGPGFLKKFKSILCSMSFHGVDCNAKANTLSLCTIKMQLQ